MTQVDLGAAAKQAEDILAQLDRMRAEVEAFQRKMVRAAEQQAEALVLANVPPDRQEPARRLVARSVRIADEVGSWMVGRSPWALAGRLLPEFRAGAHELVEFLQGPAAPPELPRSTTPPTPARSAP